MITLRGNPNPRVFVYRVKFCTWKSEFVNHRPFFAHQMSINNRPPVMNFSVLSEAALSISRDDGDFDDGCSSLAESSATLSPSVAYPHPKAPIQIPSSPTAEHPFSTALRPVLESKHADSKNIEKLKNRKPWWRRSWSSIRKFFGRRRNRFLILISLITLLIIFGLTVLIFYLVVPTLVTKSFSSYDTSGGWPPMDFYAFEQNHIRFRVNSSLGFSNYVPTELEFQQPLVFSTNGTTVAMVSFPTVEFGPRASFHLEHDFDFILLDPSIWETLWKRWLAAALDEERTPQEWKQPTVWQIDGVVTVRMVGMVWRDIPIRKFMEWNGGLEAGTPPLEMKMHRWSFLSSVTSPGLRLDMAYNNTGQMAIDFGKLSFSLDSMYRLNDSLSRPVHLVNTYLPDFYLRGGIHNITIESRFLRNNSNSISSVFQLGKDFLRNKTSVIVLRDFNIRYRNVSSGEEYTVPWANNILQSVSFMIELRREESLGKLLSTSISDWLTTTVETIGDFGGDWDKNHTTLNDFYPNRNESRL